MTMNLDLPQLIKPVNAQDHILGPRNAAVTLVEYGDYECPYCGMAHPIVASVLENLADEVRYVFRHFPLRKVHPHAETAGQAAEAAGAQGKFWEMHDLLFENQAALEVEDLVERAVGLQLNIEEFVQDLETERFAPKVQSDFLGGVQSGVNGTPCFFINGFRYDGSWDEDTLTQALRATGRAARVR